MLDLRLEFKRFRREDFSEYLSWFQDADLCAQLGPMAEGDEWLECVLAENASARPKGCTYSVFQGEQLVSVIEIIYPYDAELAYCIAAFAVKPSLRGRGLGRSVLKDIMALHRMHLGQYWTAHVAQQNKRAKLFFENNGWINTKVPPDNDGMYLLEFRAHPAL